MSRKSTLSILYGKVGFEFEESKLSPALRRRLTGLMEMESSLDSAGHEIERLGKDKDTAWLLVFILGTLAVGILVASATGIWLLPLGILLIGVAGYLYYGRIGSIRIPSRKKGGSSPR
jgi:hypothetical protein